MVKPLLNLVGWNDTPRSLQSVKRDRHAMRRFLASVEEISNCMLYLSLQKKYRYSMDLRIIYYKLETTCRMVILA